MANTEAPSNVSWPQGSHKQWKRVNDSGEAPRNIAFIKNLKLDPKLQPKDYQILGTHKKSRILFTDVKILDSTGAKPYPGDVLIEGESA